MKLTLWRRRRREEELEEEIQSHLRMAIRDRMERGESAEEAELAARREFGNVGLIKETTRGMWGFVALETFRQDLRYGARMLLKNPGFTLVAALTLALGIGANTAIFGLVDAALFRPLPVVEAPDRLVVFDRGGRGTWRAISYPDFKVLRERNEVLSGLELSTHTQISFGAGVRSEIVVGSLVSANYFDVLGVKPALGRTFLPEEDHTPGAHPVVVLSHGFWRSRFDSAPALVGRTIVLNNQRFTVIGVAPAGFDGEISPVKVNLWVPAMMITTMMMPTPWERQVPQDLLSDRRHERFGAIGRLKRGVTVAQAQAALETINRQLEQANPIPPERRFDPNTDRSLRLIRPQGVVVNFREMAVTASGLLAATVITVLLIACANVANLLLARAATRRKEVAVRLALGATRWRLIRQLLTESVLLSLVGATAGLLLAYWINQLLMAFKPPFPSAFTFTLDLSLDRRALGFTLLLAVVTGVIFGLFPALQASRPDVVPALKDESGAEGSRRRWLNLRGALVVTQVALSLALLISTGLFLRSLRYMQQIDLGFKPDNVLEASFNLGLQGYNEAKGREFYRQIVERLERLPGAHSACVTNMLPLGFLALSSPVVPEGREIPPSERLFAGNFAVGPRYFETIGTPLIRGRDFTAQDTINSPKVAIVSEKLARSLWPEIKDPGEALGKRLRAGDSDPISCEVIGVAKDSKNNIFNSIDSDSRPTIYRPFTQNYSASASVVVLASGDPRGLIPAVRREVAALDENLPAQDLQPLTDQGYRALVTVRVTLGPKSRPGSKNKDPT